MIAAGVLTSGFGLVGGDEGGGGRQGASTAAASRHDEKMEVAVLNATQEQAADGTEIAGVQGLADVVAKEVVKPADGFKVGAKTDAAPALPRPRSCSSRTARTRPTSSPTAVEPTSSASPR